MRMREEGGVGRRLQIGFAAGGISLLERLGMFEFTPQEPRLKIEYINTEPFVEGWHQGPINR